MNAKQRRIVRRAWMEKHKEEMEKVIIWINSPEKFVPLDHFSSDDVIEMEEEKIKAFGEFYTMGKRGWKQFLIEKGVFPEIPKKYREGKKL